MFKNINMKTQNNTVNARIREQMQKLGLKNKDLAEATGATKGTVSQWVNDGNGPSAQFITPLARVLGVSEQWLLQGGSNRKGLTVNTRGLQRIPLLSLRQAGEWSDLMNQDLTHFQDWVTVSEDISPFSFAVQMDNDSMVSAVGDVTIPQGATLIVDPTQEPTAGRVVVALLDDNKTVTIKKLSIDGPNIYLVPLNSNYKAMQIANLQQVIGVCLQMLSKLP
ncbi:helix-turn-helix domain-containing protein [Salmonella enterica]|uniref:XRE family transcriptional regulator n=4 Tax=Salmonella enterica TaxID=28901 RepID=A0A5V6DL76_SALET|nr:LexA family transcriptional regulator [Salmonella enterica]EBH9883080.1 helix-turn-helix domain-containing protein [Salmonella enterica subsp. enterica serovar Kisarawe]EBP4059996.1 helix-turn-helix domain-containing protein [Salmonella enterica subsp. enterica]EBQ9204087.1 XRE family transcriptional regulator [Salmonella enterica subsp. enterica serovar Anecho]EBR9059651.1 LexA family transcriptional regulator [Salmonella enterica subsp. enterica serovar Koketime]EBS5142284.1 LexA family t